MPSCCLASLPLTRSAVCSGECLLTACLHDATVNCLSSYKTQLFLYGSQTVPTDRPTAAMHVLGRQPFGQIAPRSNCCPAVAQGGNASSILGCLLQQAQHLRAGAFLPPHVPALSVSSWKPHLQAVSHVPISQMQLWTKAQEQHQKWLCPAACVTSDAGSPPAYQRSPTTSAR